MLSREHGSNATKKRQNNIKTTLSALPGDRRALRTNATQHGWNTVATRLQHSCNTVATQLKILFVLQYCCNVTEMRSLNVFHRCTKQSYRWYCTSRSFSYYLLPAASSQSAAEYVDEEELIWFQRLQYSTNNKLCKTDNTITMTTTTEDPIILAPLPTDGTTVAGTNSYE